MSDTIYLICGKSGAGKTTVVRKLESSFSLKQVQSYTTRFPRYHNEPGHIFVSNYYEWVEKNKDENIVAYTYFDGNHYWATQSQVDSCDMYVIDKEGVESFAKRYRGPKKVRVIYIDCSAMERFFRMMERGDSFKSTVRRLWHDHFAFKDLKKRADFVASNDDVVDWCATDIARYMGV